MSIVFALISLGAAAVNDLIFKFYARKNRSRGWYVMVIGLVWATVFLLFLDFDFTLWHMTLFWGVFSGIFSVAANILLIEAMSFQGAGFCSMIYRLNLVAVSFGAFLFLGESFTLSKIIGLLLAVSAIILFFDFSENTLVGGKPGKKGIVLLILAALLRAGMGLSYKYAFMQGADYNGVITLNGILWIFGGMSYALLKEPESQAAEKKCWLYGSVSGLLISGVVLFMALALKHGEAGIVIPVSQMSFIVTFVLSVLLLKENFTIKKVMGLASGVLCIITLAV